MKDGLKYLNILNAKLHVLSTVLTVQEEYSQLFYI